MRYHLVASRSLGDQGLSAGEYVNNRENQDGKSDQCGSFSGEISFTMILN